jgi:hypothetical protein
VGLAAVRGYRLYGGLRQVTCPETMESAIVKINATRAIASKLAGRNDLRLRSCSRWPEKKGCDQACLAQLKATPGGCRALPLRARRQGVLFFGRMAPVTMSISSISIPRLSLRFSTSALN